MREAIRVFDQRLTQYILHIPESWRGFFLLVTSLGDPIVTVGIGIIVTAIGWMQHNIRLCIAGASIWVTLLIGSGLKLLFGRARPVTEYAANLRIDTFSFPSGHSSGAMIAYGLIAYVCWQVLPQPWGWIVAIICGLIIFGVGISRVYLGAHFPSDVIAGWALGAVALLIVIFVVRPLG